MVMLSMTLSAICNLILHYNQQFFRFVAAVSSRVILSVAGSNGREHMIGAIAGDIIGSAHVQQHVMETLPADLAEIVEAFQARLTGGKP